jgi:hypothetical protein
MTLCPGFTPRRVSRLYTTTCHRQRLLGGGLGGRWGVCASPRAHMPEALHRAVRASAQLTVCTWPCFSSQYVHGPVSFALQSSSLSLSRACGLSCCTGSRGRLWSTAPGRVGRCARSSGCDGVWNGRCMDRSWSDSPRRWILRSKVIHWPRLLRGCRAALMSGDNCTPGEAGRDRNSCDSMIVNGL